MLKKSAGHVAFVTDVYGVEQEIVLGLDADYYMASASNAFDTVGNRVGFRPAPLGLAADAILTAGATPSWRMEKYVAQHQANIFKVS